MRIFICIGLVLLLATQSLAETYSWIDDSGTYNFAEDYSSVPKKYRKKVKWRDDAPQDASPQTPLTPEKPAGQSEKIEAGDVAIQGGNRNSYGGKSWAEWRKELDIREAELAGLEQRMDQLLKQINDGKGITKARFDVLKMDYEETRAVYEQKYKSYLELVETARKSGVTVEIKK